MTDEQTTPIDEQTETAEEPQLPEIRVENMLRMTIDMFAEMAWVKLGVRMDRASGETATDLPQARLAIDVISAMVPLIEGRLDPHEVRDAHNLLSSLQLNYVQRATKG